MERGRLGRYMENRKKVRELIFFSQGISHLLFMREECCGKINSQKLVSLLKIALFFKFCRAYMY